MNIDKNVQSDLTTALELYLDENNDRRRVALKYLSELRTRSTSDFIIYLILHLSNMETSQSSRAVAAVFLYNAIHKKGQEAQKSFILQWFNVNIEVREQLRVSATQNFYDSYPALRRQSSNLLGLFYAIEFSSGFSREPVNQVFLQTFYELMDAAETTNDLELKCLLFSMFATFSFHSLEINQNCSKDQNFFKLSPRLFSLFLNGMNINDQNVQKIALNSFTISLMIFKRTISFDEPRNKLMETIFQLIQVDNVEIYTASYQLLKKLIDYCYPDVLPHMPTIQEITLNDLKSGIPEREVQACFIWSIVAEVEWDINNSEKHLVKYKHREFLPLCNTDGYSASAFVNLFESLVLIICNTDVKETEAHISLDLNPVHTAFLCISNLARAIDELALAPIFEFIHQYSKSNDWRFRYTSELLLNAASQLPSFIDNVNCIFVAFQFFVETIVDPIPRISEVAMWSLGRMVEEIPELASDPQRFSLICENVLQKMDVSDELTSRACWLLNTCFEVFSIEDEESPLVCNFDKLADSLLQVVDKHDVSAQDAAFGALNKLIEKTPSSLTVSYNLLFEKVTAKLATLIDSDTEVKNSPKYTQMMIGLLSLIQAIVMNVGNLISQVSDALMSMLITSLNSLDGALVCEVLPAMGAVARAIGPNFEKYLNDLLGKVFEYLSQEEYVQPAAVFVNDIFNAFLSFPDELTNLFVESLFNALKFENLTIQARLATFSALSEIAKQIGSKSVTWIETYLELLEAESRSVMPNNNDIDLENANTFANETLQIYQTLVPILKDIPKGDRKVRNFFYIFEKITNMERISDDVLVQSVLLIKLITITFQSKVNVYINRPAVLQILRSASESQEENLSQLASETLEYVKSF